MKLYGDEVELRNSLLSHNTIQKVESILLIRVSLPAFKGKGRVVFSNLIEQLTPLHDNGIEICNALKELKILLLFMSSAL